MLDETPVLPPVHLAARVGATHADNLALYEEFGAETRDEIFALLPSDWSFEDKRVLDFGCGAGRTLRHFLREAEVGKMYGCDIDSESIAWLDGHLSPPLHVFRNGERPPLPLADESLDLVWAISVFTHLTYHWSAWLLELHRVLAPDGLLIATFHGGGAIAAFTDETWHAERIGMNVLLHGQGWDRGGPTVLLSPWWLREHWGRLFEIVTIREDGFAVRSTREQKPASWGGQGVVLLRRKPVSVSIEELEWIDPSEPRELEALRHNLEQVHLESYAARVERDRLEKQIATRTGDEAAVRARIEELEHELTALLTSESWRVTAPLRFTASRLRPLVPRHRGRQ